jgi:hypothetical protein
MKHLILCAIALFFFVNLAITQSTIKIGVLAGSQRVNIKNSSYGTINGKHSAYGEYKLTSSVNLGRHSLVFGLGQRTQRTIVDYVTQKSSGSFLGDIVIVIFGGSPTSSVTPIYHAAEKIELNNKYLTIPLGIEIVLNKSTEKGYLYLLPQINGNVITKNQRSFHITKNYDFLQNAELAAERFKNIPFKSFVNCSLEFGGKIYCKKWGFGGGLTYQAGNSSMYGNYGGVKSTLSVNLFVEYSFMKRKN